MFTGHPKGLFRLFFIEMWERLGFYTMVGILLLYTIDKEQGGLGLSQVVGNEIYGLYLAFVYFTPYLGGLIADRFIGYRKAVFVGGVFFVLGYFLMSIYGRVPFVSGLVCLCIGNGFFKPNISVMVGNLYEPGDKQRDAGFNIFYMGINIGAFFANYLAANLRNNFGWSAVFLGASVGMAIGVLILLLSWKILARADRPPERNPDDMSIARMLSTILGPAFLFGIIGYFAGTMLPASIPLRPAVCGFLAGMVPIVIFFVRLGLNAKSEEKPGLLALLPIYVAGGTFFMVLHLNGSAMTSWAKFNTDRSLASIPGVVRWIPEVLELTENAFPEYYQNASPDDPRPNRQSLLVVPSEDIASMYGQKRMNPESLATIEGALGEGVSVFDLSAEGAKPEEGWDARSVGIYAEVSIETSTDSHGVTTRTVTTPEGAVPQKRVVFLRDVDGAKVPQFVVHQATFDDLYEAYVKKHGKPPEELPPGEYMQIANSELFQSLNALFVVAFTPLVIFLFGWLDRRGVDFSTARKMFAGLGLTTASLLVMVLAAMVSGDGHHKVTYFWLVGFYAVITAGELCLSPMALSLVTKLSPRRLVGLTMGGWFLATAFGNNFSGFFGGLQSQMAPTTFFLLLSGIAAAVSVFILLLLPKLDAAIKKYGA